MNEESSNKKHAVVKLTNGEELICKVDNEILTDFPKLVKEGLIYITMYHPMKATVEQYYEKGDGENISIYEKTIMTSWIRFAYLDEVEMPVGQIMLICIPNNNVCEKYDDLILKYHTYATNPEFAEELYGSVDAEQFYNDMDDEPDYDDDDDDDTVDFDPDERFDDKE